MAGAGPSTFNPEFSLVLSATGNTIISAQNMTGKPVLHKGRPVRCSCIRCKMGSTKRTWFCSVSGIRHVCSLPFPTTRSLCIESSKGCGTRRCSLNSMNINPSIGFTIMVHTGRGLDDVRQHFQIWKTGFPDFQYHTQILFGDGEIVTANTTLTGTHTGYPILGHLQFRPQVTQ